MSSSMLKLALMAVSIQAAAVQDGGSTYMRTTHSKNNTAYGSQGDEDLTSNKVVVESTPHALLLKDSNFQENDDTETSEAAEKKLAEADKKLAEADKKAAEADRKIAEAKEIKLQADAEMKQVMVAKETAAVAATEALSDGPMMVKSAVNGKCLFHNAFQTVNNQAALQGRPGLYDWGSGGEYCGHPGGKAALIDNTQAVWKFEHLVDDKYTIHSSLDMVNCIVTHADGNFFFYNWHHGKDYCGFENGKQQLLDNKQAVFTIEQKSEGYTIKSELTNKCLSVSGNIVSFETCTSSNAVWVITDLEGQFAKTRCMSKQLCFNEFPEEKINDKEWQCNCLWGTLPNDPMCREWDQCIASKESTEAQSLKIVTKVIRDLEANSLLQQVDADNTGMATIQAASCSDIQSTSNCKFWKNRYCSWHSWVKTNCQKTCGICQVEADLAGCQNPTTMDITAVECECGATFRARCEADPNPQSCWENELCTNEGVCASWQEKHCSASLLVNKSTLTEQGPASPVMRSFPARASLQGQGEDQQAASMEESLTGKRSC